jgi:NAD(P)-dependent dehydrogenase (short-subunit alcohol dehydrogenase family)
MSDLAIITGASRGIGLACARRFLSRGVDVISLARTRAGTAGVTELVVDLAAPGFERDVAATLVVAAAASERVVVVHNAALMSRDTVEGVDATEYRRMLEVALVAPAALNQILIPQMRPGSAIVYIGSTLSEKAVPGAFSYVVTKHATIGMMRATCQDLLGREIHTACVCPGVTDTEMLRAHVSNDAAVLDALRAMTGSGRLVTPEEIADVVEMVARQPVLNGAVLHANLGQRER